MCNYESMNNDDYMINDDDDDDYKYNYDDAHEDLEFDQEIFSNPKRKTQERSPANCQELQYSMNDANNSNYENNDDLFPLYRINCDVLHLVNQNKENV